MKKIMTLLLALVVCFSVTACGGGDNGENGDKALVGKYIAISGSLGEALDFTPEDLKDFTLELKEGGKAFITIAGEMTPEGSWKKDGQKINFEFEDAKMTANLGEDTIEFEKFLPDIMASEMSLTFAKEGSAAAKTEK
jgi:uncharacterized lipoprotein YehR (DUF1307 family)